MNHPLVGVREKLKRADKHLAFLNTKITAYLDRKTYSIIQKPDVGDGQPGLILRVTEQPHPSLSTIVGDVVHNLRSALDYLAHELVIRNGFSPTRMTLFPICGTRDEFLNEAICKSRLAGISLPAFNLIDKMQPHALGADYTKHTLWILAKLSNLDKHKALALAGLGAVAQLNHYTADGTFIRTDTIERPMHDGDVLLRVTPDFIQNKVRTDGRVGLAITFQDAPVAGVTVTGALKTAHDLIKQDMVPVFEPFFY